MQSLRNTGHEISWSFFCAQKGQVRWWPAAYALQSVSAYVVGLGYSHRLWNLLVMDEIQQHWLYALSAPMVSINPGAGYLEAPPSSAGECFASCMVGASENGKHLNLQAQKAAAHQENPVQLIPMKWPGAFASVPA